MLALAVSICIGVVGQLSLKSGAVKITGDKMSFLQPFLILGLACYFVAALLYIFALREIPVSIAFPSVSISYVAVAYLSHLLWKEPFGIPQIIALLFIGSGIYILFRS